MKAQLERKIRVGIMPDAPEEVKGRAAIHELGLGDFPQRSFVRAWFDKARATGELQKGLQALAMAMVEGKSEAELNGLLETHLAEPMRQFILSGQVKPPVSEAVAQHKGHSITLLDSGELVRHIRAEFFK